MAEANSRGLPTPRFFVLCWRAQILSQNIQVSGSNPISSTYQRYDPEHMASFFRALVASPVTGIADGTECSIISKALTTVPCPK